MNLYHCMIDLDHEAKALSFARALDDWMGLLQRRGTIRSWRLLRRKLNLASDSCRDFLLEIEVDDLAQLDRAFRLLGQPDDEVAAAYGQVHRMVARRRVRALPPLPRPRTGGADGADLSSASAHGTCSRARFTHWRTVR
jgi:hypothetical protein